MWLCKIEQTNPNQTETKQKNTPQSSAEGLLAGLEEVFAFAAEGLGRELL